MKRFVVVLFALVALGFAPAARANPVTLDLNCVWSGGTCAYHAPSFGTITIADTGSNSHWVTVTVALNSPLDDVLNVYLNWTGTIGSGYGWYLLDGAGSSVAFTPNAEGPDGKLDIAIDTGVATQTTWTGTLELRRWWFYHYDYQDLDPSQFNVKDVNGYYAFADVHDGTYMTVGAEDYVPPPPVSEVPEPATLTLLGTGLFGLAIAVRRRLTR